ncbi:MAG: cytochrome c [Thermodesulfobacteriota bacterium]
MNKKLVLFLGLFVFLVAHVGVSLAELDGNHRKGRYLFRQNCFTQCHSDREDADYLGPDAKTQAEWEEVFANPQDLPCHEEWSDLSEQDLLDIHTYMHKGAKDSPTPTSCG